MFSGIPGNGKPHQPPKGITFLAGLDNDLRAGLASEIRAQWTHHSTALEGNTLTLGDTIFVLQEGLTVSGKSLKDHQEIVGHAQAIDLVYHIVDQRRALTVDDVHAMHRMVQTERVVDVFNPVGRWKVEPNGTTALTTTGVQQWHDYAQCADVSALMNEWIEQFNYQLRVGADRLDAYTDLHLGFTAIHPYADGNGRMARLLANLPVLAGGDPPILVPLERRRDYITRMGDWSVARGAPKPGEPLISRIPEWEALRNFFADITQPARDLVTVYRERQRERNNA